MSAMAAILTKDRVHMLADCAIYNPKTGDLTGVMPKIWPVPGTGAVFSSRGSALAFPLFAAIVEKVGIDSFDTLVAVLPELMEAHTAALVDGKCEILIAGWSTERNQPEAYFHCSHRGWDGLETGKVYRFAEGVAQFGLDDADFPAADEFDPAVHGIAAFEAARGRPQDLSCGEAEAVTGYSVGGGVVHAEITVEGMTRKTLRSWPDLIGAPIDPARDWGVAA